MTNAKGCWRDNRFSPWVRSSLKQISSVPSGLALDIPCGRGRHSHLLMELGFQVMGADIDAEALGIAAAHPRAGESFLGVQLDALEPLPFSTETFDLLVVIHPHSLQVMSNALACLRIGGYLIYETFGAQGENWRLLPKASEIPVDMLANFMVLSCKEVRVKKAPDVVTSKGLFRKTAS
jgi:SAM-dependent methyltransferase